MECLVGSVLVFCQIFEGRPILLVRLVQVVLEVYPLITLFKLHFRSHPFLVWLEGRLFLHLLLELDCLVGRLQLLLVNLLLLLQVMDGLKATFWRLLDEPMIEQCRQGALRRGDLQLHLL